jgi:hypothetical protein
MNHYKDGRSQLRLTGDLGGGGIARGTMTEKKEAAILTEWDAAVENGTQVMTRSTYVRYTRCVPRSTLVLLVTSIGRHTCSLIDMHHYSYIIAALGQKTRRRILLFMQGGKRGCFEMND